MTLGAFSDAGAAFLGLLRDALESAGAGAAGCSSGTS